MKTLIEDEFDDQYWSYRIKYVSLISNVADALRRAGSFGSRNG